jgi:hypothetical protein
MVGPASTELLSGQQIQVRNRNTAEENERLTDLIAHDVAEDMLAVGMASVTMIQRNKTCEYATSVPSPNIVLIFRIVVIPIEHYMGTHERMFPNTNVESSGLINPRGIQ